MTRKLLISVLVLLASAAQSFAQTDIQKAMANAAAAYTKAPEEAAPEEKPQYWTNKAEFTLGFNQTGLFRWAAGGYNTVTLNAGIDAKANYKKDLMSWDNRLQLQYGFLWSADKKNLLQKSNDLMYLQSLWAYKTGPESKWNYSASFDFRSQFADTYVNYVQDSDGDRWHGTLKSGLFSPAYTNLALGLEWKPTSWFNLNIAPVTGGFTICGIESLRYKYGMHLKDPDNLPEGFSPTMDGAGKYYRSFLFQFGAQIKATAAVSINDKFNFETQLTYFTDYLNQPFKTGRVNWDNKISWQAAKFFKIALETWMIYDPLIKDDNGKVVQFKEFLSLSFAYTIKNK